MDFRFELGLLSFGTKDPSPGRILSHYKDQINWVSLYNVGTDKPIWSSSILPGNGGWRERTRLLPPEQQRNGSVLLLPLLQVSLCAIIHIDSWFLQCHNSSYDDTLGNYKNSPFIAICAILSTRDCSVRKSHLSSVLRRGNFEVMLCFLTKIMSVANWNGLQT